MNAKKKKSKFSTESAAPPEPSDAPSDQAEKVAQPEEAAKSASKSAKTKPARMASKAAAVKPAAKKAPKSAKTSSEAKKTPKATSKVKKPAAAKSAGKAKTPAAQETATVLDSQVAYEGPLFRVLRDHIVEPSGRESYRDVIRHHGSVVILAVDPGKEKRIKRKKDPWIVIERQYRHAAGQYLWELPAGKMDAGEVALDGAKRELAEETGYAAKKWSPLVEYFASPGFLGESMKVFLAEGLVAGEAHPEDDEHIDFRLVRLSELLEMVDQGKIVDGKTLTTILLYARRLGLKSPSKHKG